MKKWLCIFLFMFSLCAFVGCTRSDKSITNSITQLKYYPLNQIMTFANEAVLAECVGTHTYPEGYGEIEFVVKKRFFGEESNTVIYVYCENTINEVEEYSYSYDSSIITYENNKNYYLILSRSIHAELEHDVYTLLVDYIPTEDISEKSLFYGRTPAECQDDLFREITQSAEKMDAYLSGYDASSNLLYRGRKYLTTDDETVIIRESDYIFRILIGERTMGELALDKEIHNCTIVRSIKGEYEEGWELFIPFPKNLVSQGEEYIIALNLPYDELAEEKPDASAIHDRKVLVASSKKFFLSMTEEEIINILENQE